MPEEPSLAKQAILQIASGGSAGFVEVCIMHPLDLVKTRFQIQSKMTAPGDPHYYTGIADCMRKMYSHEGFLAFWKGLLPPVMVETPKRAVKFFTFEQYKRFFLFGSPSPTPLTFSLAGFGAGITEAVIVNPFEVVKVTLQSNKAKLRELPSTWSVTKKIIDKEGLGFRGLNKGLTATMARNGAFNMVYFGFYHSVKGYLPQYKDETAEFFRKVGIGFVSGTLASCINIPFDVAKSRIQGPQPVPGQVKYRGTLQSLSLVYHEEGLGSSYRPTFQLGISLSSELMMIRKSLVETLENMKNLVCWRALYKGLLPKVMRLGPGGAIMLVVYDYMYEFLLEKFPNTGN